MPFTDRAQINAEGGTGGMGCMSFRREPKIPKGGPDGGNGGRGGRVVLMADDQVTDLSRFRHQVHHRAPNGGHGQGKARHGHSGGDLMVGVPPGTRVIRDGHVSWEPVIDRTRVIVGSQLVLAAALLLLAALARRRSSR